MVQVLRKRLARAYVCDLVTLLEKRTSHCSSPRSQLAQLAIEFMRGSSILSKRKHRFGSYTRRVCETTISPISRHANLFKRLCCFGRHMHFTVRHDRLCNKDFSRSQNKSTTQRRSEHASNSRIMCSVPREMKCR
jgi:hypothetical protein